MNIKYNSNQPFFYCNTVALCGKLCEAGYSWVSILPNVKFPDRVVWVFENSPELIEFVNKNIR